MARKFDKHKWFINMLRRSTFKYPPANKFLKKTKITYYIKSKTGKDLKRVKWICNKCQKEIRSDDKNLDHIKPLAGPEGFVDYNTLLANFLCDEDNFQILCEEPCHRNKTNAENEARRKYKEKYPNSIDLHTPNLRKKKVNKKRKKT